MPAYRRPSARPARKPLPPAVAKLLREVWWLVLIAATLYGILILASFDAGDPAWSTSGTNAAVRNLGGAIGAWLADVLLYLFGFSAWWWVVAAGFAILWGYRRIETGREFSRHGIYLALAGLAMWLLSSSALESLRVKNTFALPHEIHAGGVLGGGLGRLFATAFGETGATLLLLTAFIAGVSLYTRISWLAVLERVGTWLETAYGLVMSRWHEHRDRRHGQMASSAREEMLEIERARILDQEPVPVVPPVTEIAKSARVDKERQTPLFQEMPDSPLPPLHLLDPPPAEAEVLSAEAMEYTSRLIEKKLREFGVEVKVLAAYPGPVITRYEIEPASGVKGSQILNLVKDLARALSVASIRVVETIPGKTCMGLEIPNPKRQVVKLSEILSSQAYAEMASPLTLTLGKDISGQPIVADLAKMPHLMVAGTTGSGKSVAINAMILSLIYKAEPSTVRLILVDPKMLELSSYEGIPQLLAPVVTDMRLAATALNWCVGEMERRFRLMSGVGVRNLSGYNQKIAEAEKAGQPLTHPFSLTPDNPEPLQPMPHIVVIIDELADLMMVAGKKVEELIARLAQKARAAGLHLILATQRPSVDVITGLIKANIPTRIAFQVSSRVDSRTILDQQGAESLLGQGDMLFLPPGHGYPQRIHGAFVSDAEVHRVTDYLKQIGGPQYVEEVLAEPEEEEAGEGGPDAEADPLYDEAVALVLRTRRASISAVQRHLRIGYNRAARLIEAMERAGLVSPMQSNGNREVLVRGQPVED
jgi:S-DNA-T family DNA segregation ATPase FtsK/SpoIIIE